MNQGSIYLIDKLSCQPMGSQTTPHTLKDIECVRTPSWSLLIIDYHLSIILHLHESHE